MVWVNSLNPTSINLKFNPARSQYKNSNTNEPYQLLIKRFSPGKTFLPLANPGPASAQECHDRAWRTVQGFMEKNMQIFQARSVDADSTIMPQVFSWIDGTIDESPGCNSPDDHCLVMIFNLPAMGVISVAKWDYLITMVANALNRYKRNSLALIVHANRASQKSRTLFHRWISQTTTCWIFCVKHVPETA